MRSGGEGGRQGLHCGARGAGRDCTVRGEGGRQELHSGARGAIRDCTVRGEEGGTAMSANW